MRTRSLAWKAGYKDLRVLRQLDYVSLKESTIPKSIHQRLIEVLKISRPTIAQPSNSSAEPTSSLMTWYEVRPKPLPRDEDLNEWLDDIVYKLRDVDPSGWS